MNFLIGESVADMVCCRYNPKYRFLNHFKGVSCMTYHEMPDRPSFENFKSTICHRVKEMGDLCFIENTLKSEEIWQLYELEWYPECLYMLAMLDYLCRENELPVCSDYNDLRSFKLEHIMFPAGVLIVDKLHDNNKMREKSWNEAIPEFKRFNIVECEVRDVL